MSNLHETFTKDIPSSQSHQHTNRNLGPPIYLEFPQNKSWHDGIEPIRKTSYSRICICNSHQGINVDTCALSTCVSCPEVRRGAALEDEDKEKEETVSLHYGNANPEDHSVNSYLGYSNEVNADRELDRHGC